MSLKSYPRRLYPVDDVERQVRDFDGRQWIYWHTTSLVHRFDYRDRSGSQTTNPVFDVAVDCPELTTGFVESLWCSKATGATFVIVIEQDGGAGTRHLYRASSPAVGSWTRVLLIGTNGTTHRPHRRLLGRNSMANVTLVNGALAIIIAEYRFQVTADENETYARISLDDGATWAVMWQVNGELDAENFIRHFHSVHQDPYDRGIVLTTGDTDDESWMVRGPAQADWSAIDLPGTGAAGVAAINAVDGFDAVGGAQRHRAVDIVFREDYLYTHTDTGADHPDVGIWRWKRADLSGGHRVLYTAPTDVNDSLGSRIWQWGDTIYAIDSVVTGTNEPVMFCYASRNGVDWHVIGRINLSIEFDGSGPTTGGFTMVFQTPDGLIWLGSNNIGEYIAYAGGGWRTPVLKQLNEEWEPWRGMEILAPCKWVDADSGDDANSGRNSRQPLKTLAGVFDGGTTGAGCRVLANGRFVETTQFVVENWGTAGANRGHPNYPSVLEFTPGSTWHSTHTGSAAFRHAGSGLGNEDIAGPLIIRGCARITWDVTGQAAWGISRYDSATTPGKPFQVMYDDCEIGSAAGSDRFWLSNSLAEAATQIRLWLRRCILRGNGAYANGMMRQQSDGRVRLESTLIEATSIYAARLEGASSQIELQHVTASFTGTALVRADNNAAEPICRNTISRGTHAGGTIDHTGTTPTTGADIEGNAFESNTDPVDLSTGGLAVGVDPDLDGDYRPDDAASNVIGAGVLPFRYAPPDDHLHLQTLPRRVWPRDLDGLEIRGDRATIGGYVLPQGPLRERVTATRIAR